MREGRSRDAEVVVIGAGPVGLTAALLLADAGVRTIVLERAFKPGDLPRAISLQDESLRTLALLGVADALKAESLLDTGSRYIGLNGTLLAEAKPVPSRIGQPAKSQFDQPILEQLLFDRALEHPNLDFRLGAEATQIAHDTEGVEVTYSQHTAGDDSADAVASQKQIRAQWLIGADGGKSFTRSALGISLVGTTQPQRWLVIDLLNETRELDPYAEFHCDGKRPYVLVPGVDGRLRIEFMLFDGEDADVMTRPEHIHELVVPKFRPSLDDADVRRAAVYVAHQRIASTYREGRAFLVGDAAHLMPPFAGQGLNAGIRDAHNIAWKLIEAIRGGATDALMETYGTERRTHGASMVKISHRIGAVVMATNPVLTRVRDAAVKVVNLVPSARSFLANMRFITPPDYSDGVAIAPIEGSTTSAPEITVGRALSQPLVQDVSGEVAGLDQYLGSGWAVIGLGANPADLGGYWRGIGATHIALQRPSQGRPESQTEDVLALTEMTPTLTRGIGGAATFVVVRPDRYVAAVFTLLEEEHVIAGMRRFVDDRIRAAGQVRDSSQSHELS